MSEASAPSDSIEHFPSFLARLPPDLDLEGLARKTKAFQRARGVRSATELLRLALAWGPGGHSMQRVAAWALQRGIAQLSEDALIQRLHRMGDFLAAITEKLLADGPTSPCWHGRTLRIADSTSLSKQASKGTDWRIHGVYDLGLGGFSHMEVTDSHGGEALDRGKPVTGEIRIADRGYANAQAWQRFLGSRDERTDFIVRMRWNTVRMIDPCGDRFDIIPWLMGLTQDNATHEITVWVQSGKHQIPRPIRLIVRRKTPEAIEATLKHLRRQASRKQHQIDPGSLVAAEFVIVATSLSEADFPADEVLAVYRLRWQIELAFKRLKSLMKVGAIRTRTPAGTRCWLYAHLIVALICDDLSQDVLESFPCGAF